MIIVIHQAGVGGVSDSETGAKNELSESWRSEFTCVRTPNHGLLTLSETSLLFDFGWIYKPGVLSSLSQLYFLCHGLNISPEHLHDYTLCKCHAFLMTTSRKRGRSQYGRSTQTSGSSPHLGGIARCPGPTRGSRLACFAAKLALRLFTERVLLFVVDHLRLSEHHIEDANVHR